MTSPANTTSAVVGYNPRAFTINGQPDIFLSACIHYFRVPHQLWSDRIAKAKRGGMNTIETYVAWNFHEPEKGTWLSDGDHDLDAFLAECERQGMYVIVRPGPYICAEWDFGGFPAWLANVPGIAFRQMNKPYLNALSGYFDHVCPILAKHQWTNGAGNVILVQVENEYGNLRWTRGEMDTDDDYQRWTRDALLARGITVPLITCDGWCEGTIECVNSHNPGDRMPDFRTKYPDKPIFSTEFWTAWYDAWGQPHHTRPASDIEYASLRCWAEGACGYNYYVYHGGTNFGYTPMYIQTTSYDYDAQISETGRLTDKWRASRRVALFAQTFKDILLNGEHRRDIPGARTYGDGPNLRVHETATKQRGSIVWIDNPDKEATVTGSVAPYLPEITLGPRELFPYVHDAPFGGGEGTKYLHAYAGLVKSDARILTADVRPDPYEGVRVYVYGEPGQTREIVLFHGTENGKGVDVTFDSAVPKVYTSGPSQIVALTPEMAGRTWFPEDGDPGTPVLIGPEDVRDQRPIEAVVEVAPGKTHTLYALYADGTLSELEVEAPPLPEPPALSAWETIAEPDYTATDFDDSGWTEIDEPASMIALGNGSNPYGWYRATVGIDEACDAQLHFAACSDRLTLWVNGERIGSSPVPPEERKQEWTADFDIRLKAGENVLCVLADGLGLIKGDWQIHKDQSQEKKGIYGPVTLTPSGGCYLLDVARWRFKGTLYGEREEWYSHFPAPAGIPANPGEIRWYRTTFTLDTPLDTATPLLARLDGMGKGILWLNGKNLGRYWQPAGPQRDYYMPEPWLAAGENVLVLVETEGNTPEQVSLVWDEKAAAVVTLAL